MYIRLLSRVSSRSRWKNYREPRRGTFPEDWVTAVHLNPMADWQCEKSRPLRRPSAGPSGPTLKNYISPPGCAAERRASVSSEARAPAVVEVVALAASKWDRSEYAELPSNRQATFRRRLIRGFAFLHETHCRGCGVRLSQPFSAFWVQPLTRVPSFRRNLDYKTPPALNTSVSNRRHSTRWNLDRPLHQLGARLSPRRWMKGDPPAGKHRRGLRRACAASYREVAC